MKKYENFNKTSEFPLNLANTIDHQRIFQTDLIRRFQRPNNFDSHSAINRTCNLISALLHSRLVIAVAQTNREVRGCERHQRSWSTGGVQRREMCSKMRNLAIS